MSNKYQFRERGKENHFQIKNDFINYCQNQYNESLKLRKAPDNYYSYDFGQTWNHISNFKSERQTIQNEKSQKVYNKNSSSESKHDKSESSWGTTLFVLGMIAFGVYFFVIKDDNKNVPAAKKTIENGALHSDEESFSGNSQFEASELGEDNYCTTCKGAGEVRGCNAIGCKNGKMHCSNCDGTGWAYGKACLDCSGQGIILCKTCGGAPSSVFRTCTTCLGKKYTHDEVCNQCKGSGCFWCGDGNVEIPDGMNQEMYNSRVLLFGK